MDQLGPVLIGVDFSAASASALAQGLRVAAWGRSPVHVLHVVEPPIVIPPDLAGAYIPIPLDIDLVAEAKARWAKFAPDLPGRSGLALETAVGSPVTEMCQRARALAAGLLVVGSHGAARGPGTVGAIAGGCARHAPCPVLMLRGEPRGAFARVLAAVDFSDASRAALELAARISAQDNAALHVLHVYTPPWENAPGRDEWLRNMPDAPQKYEAAVNERLASLCATLSAESAYLRPVYAARPGASHATGIVRYAGEHGCDLIVMGAHGRSRLREMLLGSTAERVLRDSGCSVLAVRAVRGAPPA
jgi:universal stress protein E